MPNRLTFPLGSLAVVAAALLSAGAVVAQSPSPSPGPTTPSASPPASAAPGSPAPLDVRPEGTWLVLSYDVLGDGLVEPLGGSTLTVSLLPQGRLEGETGCGTYIGGYTVDGGAIRLGVISKGPDPCGERRTDEAFAFTMALAAATNWVATTSGLDLLDDDGQVRVSMVRPGGGGLAGDWVMQRYARADGTLREALEGSAVTITLAEDGQVAGSTGCRLFGGQYEAETDRIIIAIDVVGLPCEGEERRQDRRIRTILDTAVRWRRDGAAIFLRDTAGDVLAELTPATPAPPDEALGETPDPTPDATPDAIPDETLVATSSATPGEPAGGAVAAETVA